jgi:hypothetical protein
MKDLERPRGWARLSHDQTQPTTQTPYFLRTSLRTLHQRYCLRSIIRARLRVDLTAASTTLDCSRHVRLALAMPRLKRSATEAQLDVPTEPEMAPEAAQTLKDLRNMWEFASLMQYIFLFGNVVKIDEDFDIEVWDRNRDIRLEWRKRHGV